MKWFHRKTDKTAHKVSPAEINKATERIRKQLPVTPLTQSPTLEDLLGREIFLKWDNKFKTGSFKERGACNFLLRNLEEVKKTGVCAASAGNHALAVSRHCAALNLSCTIVMPKNAPLVKVESTRKFGAEVHLQGDSFNEAYQEALNLASKRKMRFIPAFDDPSVICGQGSAGVELLEQLDDFDSVVVPVGGGGYISGIACAIKAKRPDVFILGVQSEWAKSQGGMLGAKQGLFSPVTIADGIAVKGLGELTTELINKHVDELVTVSENHIADAIITYLKQERVVVEGASASALAAVMQDKLPSRCKRTVVMVCGSNIDVNLLSRLIERDLSRQGKLARIRVSLPDRPGSLATVTRIISEVGANVLETFHDRSFSEIPGNVDITFLLEVKNRDHRNNLLSSLQDAGISLREI